MYRVKASIVREKKRYLCPKGGKKNVYRTKALIARGQKREFCTKEREKSVYRIKRRIALRGECVNRREPET